MDKKNLEDITTCSFQEKAFKKEKSKNIIKSAITGISFGSVFPIMGYFGDITGTLELQPRYEFGLYILGSASAINIGITYYKNVLNKKDLRKYEINT